MDTCPVNIFWKGHLKSNIEKIVKILINLEKEKKKNITIGIVGKYTALEDSYSSVVEALKHVEQVAGVKVNIVFLCAREQDVIKELQDCNGVIVPGGFWDSAIENMLITLKHVRESSIPTLWICLGMQLMIIEYARNVIWIKWANSLEFDSSCSPNDVITLLDSQKNVVNLGGTMRLGRQETIISDGQIKDLYTRSERISKDGVIAERFRHRYEVHPGFAKKLAQEDLHVVWKSKHEGIVQFIEMDQGVHPYYLATQAHPELTTRLENPAPLFMWLVQACIKK